MTIEQFEQLKEYGKRKTDVNGIQLNVTLLPYIFVKGEFLSMISENKIKESVLQTLDHLEIKHKSLSVSEIYSIFIYLYDEILTENGIINKLESEYLSRETDTKMISAGVSMLAPFNTHLTLLSLCKEMNMSIDEVAKKPYYELLDYQVALFRQSKVQENYQKIITKK